MDGNVGGKMNLPPRRKDFTMYNYLIVGSGLYGAVMAQQLHAAGKKVLVIDKRPNIAGNDLPKTVISREYSSEWKPGDEPYYPVNDERNSTLYASYKALADKEDKVIFGGRLGEYKYYDMDQVIAAALERVEGLE